MKSIQKRCCAALLCLLVLVGHCTAVRAQDSGGRTVTGQVLDTEGTPIPGATIVVTGTQNAAFSDAEGRYSLRNVPENGSLDFTFMGYVPLTKRINGQSVVNAILYEDSQTLDDVRVVAFGTQKKESVIGSITTLATKQLEQPTSNLTQTLAGRVAGIISYQRSGEPGSDDASFFIRGITTFGANNNPLILIDGIELGSTDLARLQPEDIESFSIMKDATATALYGSRAANGVILVKTKEGRKGRVKVNVRLENSLSMPTQELELADPITYMQLHNEAIQTRNPLGALMYSQDKIEHTQVGSGSFIYPYTDWREALLKNYTLNQRVNVNASGGGDVARYYVAASLDRDNGILQADKNAGFNNNIRLKNYTLRSNVNINITKTTEMIVRLSGTFTDYTGPINGGTATYENIMSSNPVLFPAYYPNEALPYANHTLFGNAGNGQYLNPYAEMVKGYREYSRANMSAQFELKQNLDRITKGLSARLLYNTSRISYYSMSRAYKPFYYALSDYDYKTGAYHIANLNPDSGTDYLTYDPGEKTVTANTYVEAALNYQREFGKHGVSGLLVYQLRDNRQPNAATLQESLPYRNVGLSGRLTYAFDSRYFLEWNFGYNGSERFSPQKRWGFFPSAGAAWMISNEPFFAPLRPWVTKMKFRVSYGKVGNDNIGSARFLYLSDIDMNNADRKYNFGYNANGDALNGIAIKRYANALIGWESATKANYAWEFSLKDALNLTVEYYTEKREDILQLRSATPASMGLSAQPSANIGAAKGHGTDIALDYNKSFRNNAWLQIRGNFTWSDSEFTVYEEKQYPNAPWRSHIGYPVKQRWGYLAESLFVDEYEVRNSPQQFGEYGAGDIKYRDVNRDGVINDQDQVPIGYPTQPEICYGFGASFGKGGFDFSLFFQGLAHESFWIDYTKTSPFFDTVSGSVVGHNQLAQFVADSYWSERNRDLYALWPRLSESPVANNNQTSTWFMRDGSFLRLKQVEAGWTLPKHWTDKLSLESFRIYLSATNLLCWSGFKLWDPEMAGDGLGYPIQRTLNLGLNINF